MVLFKFRPDITETEKVNIINGLTHLYESYPERLVAHHGKDLGIQTGNYEYGICVDFTDEAQFLRYGTNAEHLKLINDHIKGAIIARSAIQFEF